MKGTDLMMNTQMLDYINESPLVATKLLKEFNKENQLRNLGVIRNVVFIGSGSSSNIARVVSTFYENDLHLNVKIYFPDSFLNLRNLNLDTEKTIVIGISETGTSTGTVEALTKAKSNGFKTIALTERTDTPLEKIGDFYFNFKSGEEKCNAKTKGYTNSLILLYLIGLKISDTSESFQNKVISYIEKAINDIPKVIDEFNEWFSKNKDWVKINNLLVIGVSNYGGAIEEGSLKVSETCLIPSRYVSYGEFSHGLHRTLNPMTNIILVNNKKNDLSLTYKYLVNKVDRVLLINSNVKSNKENINIANLPYNLTSIEIGIIFQIMAYTLPTYINNEPNALVNHDYEELVHNRM